MKLHATLVVCVLLLGSTGCVGDDLPPQPAGGPPGRGTMRPTIVAMLDTGLNPYHEAFQASTDGVRVDDYLSLVGNPELRTLSREGAFEQRRAADAAFWDNVEIGKLIAFSGTRLFGIALGSQPGIAPLLDESNHGTGTSSLVAREDPEALIVVVRLDGTTCNLEYATERCPIFPDLAVGMAWAADQDWIDIISVSAGLNIPTHSELHPEVAAYLEASRTAHERGKIVVNAAGNDPLPHTFDYNGGPPWIVSVGGLEAESRGDVYPQSSRIPDVVANYTELVARQDSLNEYLWRGGTSFSTPIVAGTLSRALREVREQLGDDGAPKGKNVLAQGKTEAGRDVEVRSADVWNALNATAVEFAATDWRPQPSSVVENLSANVPVVVAPIQTGWGYVHAGLASEIAERVLAQDFGVPSSKALTAQYQAEQQRLRQAYWDAVAPS